MTGSNVFGAVFSLTGNVTGQTQIAIPAGNYDYVTLSTFLQTAYLSATGTTITVSFGGPSFRTVIARNAGVDATLSITASDLAAGGGICMQNILGFSTTLGPSTTLTALNAHNIRGNQKLNVCSTVLNTGRNMILKNDQIIRSNIIYGFISTGNAGSIQSNFYPGEWQQFGTPQTLTYIDAWVSNENDDIVTLRGYPWGFDIEFRQAKDV